jgi:hypothetical protein
VQVACRRIQTGVDVLVTAWNGNCDDYNCRAQNAGSEKAAGQQEAGQQQYTASTAECAK